MTPRPASVKNESRELACKQTIYPVAGERRVVNPLTILLAKIKTRGIANKVELDVSAALKGKAPARLVIDLSKAPRKERADDARKLLGGSAGGPVLLFAADSVGLAYLHRTCGLCLQRRLHCRQ